VCYSSNASLRTSSDTAASIGLLLCFWQANGGAINNNGGTAFITACSFVNNEADVSDALCT